MEDFGPPDNTAPPTRSPLVDVANTFMAHVGLWVPVVVMILSKPHFERTYREFELHLPWLSECFFYPGNSAFILLAMVFLLVLDVPALYYLNRGAFSRFLCLTWAILMVIVPLALTLFSGLALWLPTLRLMDGLSHPVE